MPYKEVVKLIIDLSTHVFSWKGGLYKSFWVDTIIIETNTHNLVCIDTGRVFFYFFTYIMLWNIEQSNLIVPNKVKTFIKQGDLQIPIR